MVFNKSRTIMLPIALEKSVRTVYVAKFYFMFNRVYHLMVDNNDTRRYKYSITRPTTNAITMPRIPATSHGTGLFFIWFWNGTFCTLSFITSFPNRFARKAKWFFSCLKSDRAVLQCKRRNKMTVATLLWWNIRWQNIICRNN